MPGAAAPRAHRSTPSRAYRPASQQHAAPQPMPADMQHVPAWMATEGLGQTISRHAVLEYPQFERLPLPTADLPHHPDRFVPLSTQRQYRGRRRHRERREDAQLVTHRRLVLRALCVLRILNPLEHVDQADTAADQRPAADVRQLQWRTSTVTGRLRASTALICLPNTAEPSRSPTPSGNGRFVGPIRGRRVHLLPQPDVPPVRHQPPLQHIPAEWSRAARLCARLRTPPADR